MAAVITACRPSAAAPVDLQAGYAGRKPGVQRRPPADTRRFGIRIGLREHDVFDEFGVDAAALDHRLDRPGGQVLRA
jgi:hypothetical protein